MNLKDKRFIYILLPAMLLVWGSVVSRIKQYTDGVEIEPITVRKPIKQKQSEEVQPRLRLDYPDPFLKNHEANQTVRGESQQSIGENLTTTTSQLKMTSPFLEYLGMVRSKNKSVGIVEVKGKQHFVEQGHLLENMTVQFLNQDSIVLLYQKERIAFRKK